MNEPGDIIYKCRRCGENFKRYHVPDVEKALLCFLLEKALPVNMANPNTYIKPLDSHTCDDGFIGIADILGFKKD